MRLRCYEKKGICKDVPTINQLKALFKELNTNTLLLTQRFILVPGRGPDNFIDITNAEKEYTLKDSE
jgi:hypothetical protein